MIGSLLSIMSNYISAGNYEVTSESQKRNAIIFIDKAVQYYFKGESVSDVKNSLATKPTEKISKVKNTHNPKILDTIYELVFDGLSVIVYHATFSKRDHIAYLSISSRKYNVRYGLIIGCNKEDVRKTLGEPTCIEKKDDDLIYIYSNTSEVRFYFKNSVLQRIDWQFYLD